MLAELLKRVGETYDKDRHESDFGLESADYVADFHNNGGLEFHEVDVNYAIQYVSLTDGRIEIGAWSWFDDEDFDEDATFECYDEEDFYEEDLRKIYDRIEEIYGQSE